MCTVKLRGLSNRVGTILCRLICVQRVRLFSSKTPVAPQPLKSSEQITICIPTLEEALPYVADLQRRFNLDSSIVLRRLKCGKQVALALEGDHVIAMLWMAFDEQEISEVGHVLALHSDEFITFNAVTLPAWRNIGLSTALNCAAYAYALTLGRPVQLAWRSMSNHQALRVASKLGQSAVCDMTAVWLWGIRVNYQVRQFRSTPVLLIGAGRRLSKDREDVKLGGVKFEVQHD